MVVIIFDRNNNEYEANISIAEKKELSKIKDWNFKWFELFEKEAQIFKLNFKSEIIGLIKIKWENPDHFILANIELSPENIGSKSTYKNIAEILIAYSAMLSFKLNQGPYKGFLAFTSKGNLIKHYAKKYNAELVFRERMIISPTNCKKLIRENLNLEI